MNQAVNNTIKDSVFDANVIQINKAMVETFPTCMSQCLVILDSLSVLRNDAGCVFTLVDEEKGNNIVKWLSIINHTLVGVCWHSLPKETPPSFLTDFNGPELEVATSMILVIKAAIDYQLAKMSEKVNVLTEFKRFESMAYNDRLIRMDGFIDFIVKVRK